MTGGDMGRVAKWITDQAWLQVLGFSVLTVLGFIAFALYVHIAHPVILADPAPKGTAATLGVSGLEFQVSAFSPTRICGYVRNLKRQPLAAVRLLVEQIDAQQHVLPSTQKLIASHGLDGGHEILFRVWCTRPDVSSVRLRFIDESRNVLFVAQLPPVPLCEEVTHEFRGGKVRDAVVTAAERALRWLTFGHIPAHRAMSS